MIDVEIGNIPEISATVDNIIIDNGPALVSSTFTSNGTYYPESGYAYNNVTVDVLADVIIPCQYSYSSITEFSSTAAVVGRYAFQGCYRLSELTLNKCVCIEPYAFMYCSSLTKLDLPECKILGADAFGRCEQVSTVYLPKCEYTETYVFESCIALKNAYVPKLSIVDTAAFAGCYNLSDVNIQSAKMIEQNAFARCSSLSNIRLGSAWCSLSGSTAFDRTGITSTTGSIYVPASLINQYKSAPSWSYFSTQFIAY